MELALLLVLLVCVELAFTVWFLARQRSLRKTEKILTKRVSRLEKNVTKMAEVLRDMAEDCEIENDVHPTDLAGLVSQATPEQVEQANAILAAFNLKGEE